MIIIIFWVAFVAISIQGSSLLSSNVAESTDFVDLSTESGIGAQLLRDRFNQTSEESTHIIIINLQPDESLGAITDNQWRNFTLFLTSYLNESYLFEHGYNQPDSYISEPLILLSGIPGAEDFAGNFVSDDEKISLFWISIETDSMSALGDDVEEMRILLGDMEEFYIYVDGQIGADALNALLPTQANAEKAQLILTGGPANFVDIISSAEETFQNSEIIAVFVVVIILTVVFRSPLGMIIPLIAMIASLLPAYLITFALSELGVISISDFLPAIIAMIGIAVAVDYSLFSLVRFREEFRKRKAEHQLNGTWTPENIRATEILSAKVMNSTAGTAVMYSGITVIIGFSALLVLGSSFTGSMAFGVSTVVVMSILTARTLTPAILSVAGRYLDWPNVTTKAKQDVERLKAKEKKHGVWERWSALVMRNPLKFLLLGILIVMPFVILSAQTDLSFDTIKNLPPGTESREGFEILFEEFNLGDVNPYRVVIDAKITNGAFDADLIEAVNALGDWALQYNEIRQKDGTQMTFETVTSLSFTTNGTGTDATAIKLTATEITGILNSPDLIPAGNTSIPNFQKILFVERVLPTYVNTEFDNDTLIVDITSNLDSGSGAAWDLVRIMRVEIADIFNGLPVDIYVTGFAASFADTSDSLYGDVPLMITVAVILIYIALLILFRSVLLPAKAILTIGSSILFSLGMLVFVFQNGNLLFLFNAEQAGVTFIIPVFLFTVILGLGMDYSIFIISRIKEEYESGTPSDEAVGAGLAKTAGVVTSAATVMIATFLVFASAPALFLKTFGLGMAVAIFIDATIARTVILPAAMKLAGKWNWWLPGWLKKIIPNVELVH